MNQYDQQAIDFLRKSSTTIKKEFVKYDLYFPDDKEKRNIRSITMNNNHHSYTFTYWDSIANSKKQDTPSDYSILACLDILYETDFSDFCDSYWYDNDSMNAKKIYDACAEQDRNLRILFDRKELEQLAEIQ